MKKHLRHLFLLPAAVIFIQFSCGRKHEKEYQSLPGYHFDSPVRYLMPDELTEISGITFNKGNSDTVYAEQDEQGRIYRFHIGDTKPIATRFGKQGDYEDLAICNDLVIMLKSNGTLYTFPLSETANKKTEMVQELKDLLPVGEYEGMYADEIQHKLYVACKHCDDNKPSRWVSIYIFDVGADGSIKSSGEAGINVKQIEETTGTKKISFQPSGLAKNPVTHQWYILSSVNRMLVTADENWQAKEVYHLDSKIFFQPEGIAFDNNGNLYISNEGDELSSGNILLFNYHQP